MPCQTHQAHPTRAFRGVGLLCDGTAGRGRGRHGRGRLLRCVQGSAKEWFLGSLGCVKRAPGARGGQEAGITQPRDHSLADPCIFELP